MLKSLRIINFSLGILNLISVFLLQRINDYNYYIFLINLIIAYFYLKRFSDFFLVILSYPFGLFLGKDTKKMEKKDLFTVPLERENIKTETTFMDLLPLKSIDVLADVDVKKSIVLRIIEKVKEGVNIEENMRKLKELVKDPHPDVGLYASEGIDKIDKFYIERISKLKEREDVEGIYEYCITVLNYIDTGLVQGKLKEYFLNSVRNKANMLKEKDLKKYFEIMVRLEAENLELLREAAEYTKEKRYLEKIFYLYIKKGKYKEAKKILKELEEFDNFFQPS